jgi:hypothetical protein
VVEVAEPADLQPAAPTLSAYPNPFNPRTSVAFTLARAQTARVVAYDLAGRRVATLADRDFAAGTHRVDWDASGLASGSYLVRLEVAGEDCRSRKVTLLR